VGIVCSRLVERFHRPTILLSVRDGHCHGSGRSIEGFDLHAALSACAAHLDRFGGHSMAAGLHLDEAKLDDFREAFIAHANGLIDPEALRPGVTIDCEASVDEMTLDAVGELEKLAPFGAGNPRVRVLLKSVRVESCRPVGSEGKHLSLRVCADGDPPRQLAAIAWNWGHHDCSLARGTICDLVATPMIDTFRGERSVKLEVRDVCLRPRLQPA
jgi:single-stranded-DNA-specific exonuclease